MLRAFVLLLSIAVICAVLGAGAWFFLAETPHDIAVPDLKGRSFDEAINELKAMGLEFEVVREIGPETATNTVIRMMPEPGAMVRPGRRISLVVAEGAPMVTVPDLVGSYFVEAENILRRAGLERRAEGLLVGRTTSVVSDSPAGLILAQNPEAGSETGVGARVDLVIAVNKEGGIMPNLVNVPLDVARDSLARLGYDITSAEPYITTSWPATTIRSQLPAPGTRLAPDLVIRVIFAKPPDAPNAFPGGDAPEPEASVSNPMSEELTPPQESMKPSAASDAVKPPLPAAAPRPSPKPEGATNP